VSEATIVLLPGDGIGPEVISAARRVLEAVAETSGRRLVFEERPMGGGAMEVYGDPLPAATLEACRAADAVLLGAVGGPQWDDLDAETRPEDGLLGLRRELGLFANLRPIQTFPQLAAASPLKASVIEGVDILFVRELTGGIYFGAVSEAADGSEAGNVMSYTETEVERVVRVAADAALQRRGKVTSVDKANVLAVSRLWRRVAARVMADEYPSLEYEVVLVDAMAMHLLARPADFDVVVTGNLFGDILTDEASMIPGSLGLLPSASLGSGRVGLFEPIHGSAPDIAGKDLANPLATILAAALALRHSLEMADEAIAVERAVAAVLDKGLRTQDIAGGGSSVGTTEMTTAVVGALR
jgi:3-isopropylmalate dehydrogenase